MVVLTSSLAISERNLPGSPDHAHRWEHLEGTQVSAAPCLQANGKGLPPSENRPYSFFGGDEEDRTPDLRIANATLSQLSYVPTAVRHYNVITNNHRKETPHGPPRPRLARRPVQQPRTHRRRCAALRALERGLGAGARTHLAAAGLALR